MNTELLKSLSENIKERTGSPLFGAFAISWVGWNYRALVIIMSVSLPVEYRFQLLDNTLYNGVWPTVLRLLIYPLLTSSAMLLVYPLLARWVFTWWRLYEKALTQIRIRIDDETPLTKDEARQIRRAASALEEEMDRAIQRREATIAELNAKIQEQVKEIQGIRGSFQSLQNELATRGKQETTLSEVESKVLADVVAADATNRGNYLLKSPQDSRLSVNVAIDDLSRRGLLRINGDFLYSTDRGRRALLDYQSKKTQGP